MSDLKDFKNEIIRYTLLAGLIEMIISIPILGIDISCLAGILVGTMVTVFNFHLLVSAGEKVMDQKKAKPMVGSYFIRLVIYGVAFFIALKLNYHVAIGCAAGFITLHVAVLFTYTVVYGVFKKKKNPLNDWTEPKEWNDLSVYDDEDENWQYK